MALNPLMQPPASREVGLVFVGQASLTTGASMVEIPNEPRPTEIEMPSLNG